MDNQVHIVIKNFGHILSLGYEKHGTTVEIFGKGLIPNMRYGFLNDGEVINVAKEREITEVIQTRFSYSKLFKLFSLTEGKIKRLCGR